MPQGSRISLEESCRIARTLKVVELNDVSAASPAESLDRRASDPSTSISFIQVLVAEARLEHLTLPRAIFSRSEIRGISFRNTDLSDSTANWNDFINVDFSRSDLSRSDLRACVFKRVRFHGANLTGVDFRYCGFTECHFAEVDLTDAKLTVKAGKALNLSAEQKSVIDWQVDDGEEPEG